MLKTFQDLEVWKKAHALVIKVYKVTDLFPPEEKFGLTLQMRRASISIAANIIEGFKRKSNKDFLRFLNIAEGSLEELKYYLILSKDLSYIGKERFEKLTINSEEVGKMLGSMADHPEKFLPK